MRQFPYHSCGYYCHSTICRDPEDREQGPSSIYLRHETSSRRPGDLNCVSHNCRGKVTAQVHSMLRTFLIGCRIVNREKARDAHHVTARHMIWSTCVRTHKSGGQIKLRENTSSPQKPAMESSSLTNTECTCYPPIFGRPS